MHTAAGACIFKRKKLEKDDLLFAGNHISSCTLQFVVMGKFRNYGCLRRNEGPNCTSLSCSHDTSTTCRRWPLFIFNHLRQRHICEQLAQGWAQKRNGRGAARSRTKLTTCFAQVQRSHKAETGRSIIFKLH